MGRGILQKIKYLYELPPKKFLREVKHKILGVSRGIYQLDDILESPKHMRPQRPFDLLNRYQTILKRNLDWVDLDFEGKNILEIGSGPLLGWGPLAVLLNCASYTCVEPMFNHLIINSKAVKEKYFIPVYRDLSAIYRVTASLDQYLENLRERIAVIEKEFLDTTGDTRYDIILSNSCLEHVFPLNETIEKLANVCSPDSRLLHLVDFGNHRKTRNPFEGIYEVEPSEYFEKYGKKINLLKAPDLLNTFANKGFRLNYVPYYYFREFYKGNICSYWNKKYSGEDLFLKTAIFVGKLKL